MKVWIWSSQSHTEFKFAKPRPVLSDANVAVYPIDARGLLHRRGSRRPHDPCYCRVPRQVARFRNLAKIRRRSNHGPLGA